MIETMLAFIDAVIPTQRFVLAGYSAGGYLAQGVVSQRAASIDGVLLCVPGMRADQSIYFILLDPSAAASLIGLEEDEIKIEGGPRGLLAAEVEDVDAAYEKLLAGGVTFLRPPTDQAWGMRTAHFAIPKATSGRSTNPLKQSQRRR